MKTAISVPDDTFLLGERLAKRTGRSRSEIYSTALREYVARHDDDEVIRAIDAVMARLEGSTDAFADLAARETMARVEW
jgi:metal-responsive CopG/Arc/MetJ family transcriptional regulator